MLARLSTIVSKIKRKVADNILGFIQLGKPEHNAVLENLNAKFRNESLNQHGFKTMGKARYEVDLWREHYNYVRPYSSLIYLPPFEYATRTA